MFNDAQVEAEVKAVFDDFVRAYPKDDIDWYLSFWDRSTDLVVFGTGEKWLGWEEYKFAPAEDRKKFDHISLDYDWLKINSYGSIAWLAADASLAISEGGEVMKLPVRGTMVLTKKGEIWSIIQAHISMAPMTDTN
jgi:ketosteroid isomerase-like protein